MIAFSRGGRMLGIHSPGFPTIGTLFGEARKTPFPAIPTVLFPRLFDAF